MIEASAVPTDPTTSSPTAPSAACVTSDCARSASNSTRGAASSSTRPAGVSSVARLERSKSAAPSVLSSARICCESAGWLTCSRRAARLKCSSEATVRNTRSCRSSTSMTLILPRASGISPP